MAAIARATLLLLTPFDDISTKTLSLHHHQQRLLTTTTSTAAAAAGGAAKRHKQRSLSTAVLNCIFSSGGGGGVADEFISTRKSDWVGREFSVIADMLNRVEPFDTSLISNGVSSSAKDSMKRTISDMLGLLPSDQFSITIRVSRSRLDLLLTETILTGYTLWNAEYRVSLMRNFSISDGSVFDNGWWPSEVEEEQIEDEEERPCGDDGGVRDDDGEDFGLPQSLGELSPEALDYIQQLKSKLASLQKERDTQKQVNMHKECAREGDTNLLQYLRSFQPDMVCEISRPSSPEVEEIIHQLVQNVLQRLFSEDTGLWEDPIAGKTDNNLYADVELFDTISISRDYLAKLLFCYLLDQSRTHYLHVYAKVHAVGSSPERLGEQITP